MRHGHPLQRSHVPGSSTYTESLTKPAWHQGRDRPGKQTSFVFEEGVNYALDNDNWITYVPEGHAIPSISGGIVRFGIPAWEQLCSATVIRELRRNKIQVRAVFPGQGPTNSNLVVPASEEHRCTPPATLSNDDGNTNKLKQRAVLVVPTSEEHRCTPPATHSNDDGNTNELKQRAVKRTTSVHMAHGREKGG